MSYTNLLSQLESFKRELDEIKQTYISAVENGNSEEAKLIQRQLMNVQNELEKLISTKGNHKGGL